MSLDTQRIKKMKTILGFPDAVKFCGFVIHIPINGEFISKINSNKFFNIIRFAQTPDYAIKYMRYNKAIKASKKYDRYMTVIGYLFDLVERHIVVFESNENMNANDRN